MKDLETIYEEEFLTPKQTFKQKTIPERIEKIQGLFGSLELELIQLENSVDSRQHNDNGFAETINQILSALETPRRIFDTTFYNNRSKF